MKVEVVDVIDTVVEVRVVSEVNVGQRPHIPAQFACINAKISGISESQNLATSLQLESSRLPKHVSGVCVTLVDVVLTTESDSVWQESQV